MYEIRDFNILLHTKSNFFFTTYGTQNAMLNKLEKDKLEAQCKFVILGFINLGHLHHLF